MFVDDIIDEQPIMKLEELVQMCDQNAESRNNHDFVGAHRVLATLLFKTLGRKTTKDILVEIAELGGLDGMSGMYVDELENGDNAFEELGIKKPWHEWNLEQS